MPEHDSVQDLLDRWRAGDEAAAEALHRRYAERLTALAERQLGAGLQRRVGAADIVQSVFRTFFRRSRAGQFVVDHSVSLWRLLVTITLNKIRLQADRHHAGKRAIALEIHLGDGDLPPEAVTHDPTPWRLPPWAKSWRGCKRR